MAPVAIAMWSIALKPSAEPVSFIPQSDLRITNIALGDELADDSGRTSVKLTYSTPVKLDDDDEDDDNEDAPEPMSTTVLGSLTPGKIEQATVDIVLEEDEEYLFELVGKNTVYLTGNYIDQMPTDNAPFNSDDEEDMEDMEDAYDLREVSSDVEVDLDAAELDSDSDDAERFEEIVEEAAKSLKRPREDATMEVDTETLSKTAQKKLNKKLKAEGGKAIATGDSVEKKDDEEKTGDEKKGDKKSKKEKKKEKVEKADAAAPEKKKLTTTTLEGGLKIMDSVVGTGPTAKKGNTVGMRYIGKLADKSIFDKNVSGKAFQFTLGKGEVIKGWDIGIAGMQVGGERILTIPAPLAYGKQKNGKIPANSTLTFEVKLLSIR